jgi:hypothetical protein
MHQGFAHWSRFEGTKGEGEPFTSQARLSGNLEVDVGTHRGSGITDLTERLPHVHALPNFHSDTPWLEVRIQRKATATEIQGYLVSCHFVECEYRVPSHRILRKILSSR